MMNTVSSLYGSNIFCNIHSFENTLIFSSFGWGIFSYVTSHVFRSIICMWKHKYLMDYKTLIITFNYQMCSIVDVEHIFSTWLYIPGKCATNVFKILQTLVLDSMKTECFLLSQNSSLRTPYYWKQFNNTAWLDKFDNLTLQLYKVIFETTRIQYY